jgi:hypothetical protein
MYHTVCEKLNTKGKFVKKMIEQDLEYIKLLTF